YVRGISLGPLAPLDSFEHPTGEQRTIVERMMNISDQKIAGRGAVAEVFFVSDEQLGDIAVKKIRTDRLQNPLVIRSFYTEVLTLFGLRHENIIKYAGSHLDLKDPRRTFLAMERAAYTLDKEPVQDCTVRRVLRQMSKVLQYLKQKQMIHHDIKPENIGLTARGTVKLLDFGFACHPETQEVRCGSFRYMPDEYLMEGSVTDRFDMFSFGITLQDWLSEGMFNSVQTSISSIEETHHANMPPSLKTILEQSTTGDPDRRLTPSALNHLICGFDRETSCMLYFG
ncbi:MAG: serine/threonine protein kinase, partial [Candidatus Nanoarchaeia archaeon]